MSGTVKRVAVRLALEGADPVRAQLNAVGETGAAAMTRVQRGASSATQAQNRFNQAVTAGGFQLQDFAVQVQGGTSALTAFAQQAPQFLGVFGPGGAIAGAVVAVGALAASFLLLGNNAEAELRRTEQAFRGLEQVGQDVARVLREVNDLFLTSSERGAAAANAQRSALIEQSRRLIDVTVQRNEGNVIELAEARRERDRAERDLRAEEDRNAELRRRRQLAPVDQETALRDRLFRAEAREQGLQQDITRQSQRLGQLQEALRRAENAGVDRGTGEFGPPAPDRPSARGGGGGGGSRGPSDDALRERFLAAVGQTDARARAFEQLRRQVETFDEALQRGVVTEEEYTAAVIGANQALETRLAQLNETQNGVQRRTQRVDNTARELGLAFSSAFEDAIVKGEDLRSVLKGLEQDLARIIIRRSITEPLANAVGPIGQAAGSFFTSLFTASANGNAFSGGNVVPFARGGVIGGPTFFPMANGGVGLMGEAGPEAIMPLQRDSSGRLGVRAAGTGGPSLNITIDARGADAGVEQRIRVGMALAVQQAQRDLAASVNRGGSVAKTFGRRA